MRSDEELPSVTAPCRSVLPVTTALPVCVNVPDVDGLDALTLVFTVVSKASTEAMKRKAKMS